MIFFKYLRLITNAPEYSIETSGYYICVPVYVYFWCGAN